MSSEPSSTAPATEQTQQPAASAQTTPAEASASSKPATQTDMSKYGTHECTCDGCNAKPIVGFRYKCTRCKDHDICEICFQKFQGGVLPHVNKLNPVPREVSAHAFAPYVEAKSFTAIAGAAKQAPKTAAGKVKPNDACPCGSGKKAKKCCHAK